MADKLQFFTPVGRFVSGDLVTKRDKDHQGRAIEPDKQRYEFGLAIQKSDPGVGALIQQIATFAHGQYQNKAPHVAQRIVNWMNTLDGFSMKIANGDEPNQRGQVNKNTAGCWVFYFSTAIDIVGSVAPTNAQFPLANIKRGWFVDVAGSAAINDLVDNNAGIYLNPTIVRLIAEGDEIIGSVDPQQVYANHAAPVQLPPGARPIGSAPGVPTGAGLPGVGQMPMGNAGAPAMPAMGGQVAGVPAGMPAFPGAVSQGNSIASPSSGFPQHPGILGLPQ